MTYVLPDLCDDYPESIQVIEPGFGNFGGRESFGGEIVTIKCHEDNSLVAAQVELPGNGKVLVVDGGGSLRCGLLGDNLAIKAGKMRHAHAIRSNVAFIERFVESSSMLSHSIHAIF